MREAGQASQPGAGLGLGLVHAASATARLGWGVISDRWFPWNRKRLFLAIGCAGTVFLLAISGVGPGPWGILFGGVLAVMLGLTVAAYAGLVQTMTVETVELREARSEEHTSELQSLMRISYAVFCLKKKNKH